MSGDMKKRLIFSMYTTSINLDERSNSARIGGAGNMFEKHFERLVQGHKALAEMWDADYILDRPSQTDSVKEFDKLTMWKLFKLEEYVEQYEQVLYLDLDVIPNLKNIKKNMFEEFDFTKIVSGCNDTHDLALFKNVHEMRDKDNWYKSLDKYHWSVKTKMFHHMLLSQLIEPKFYRMINTGIWGGSKTATNKLKFSKRFDECKEVLDEIKDMDNRYFYNNEVFISYILEKYKLEDNFDLVPDHWHRFFLNDSSYDSCKTACLIHVMNKDFEGVFKAIDS
jgi:lipopolysaccharide biosynthesis glycosyltransferase|tara:strand:- start:63 stop:902 length:840 start_codon:yes stop_codon:yes gene_type:complete